MDLVTEYLIIIEKNNANALYNLCDTPQEFKKLLQTDPQIVIKNNKFIIKDKLECAFNVQTNTVEGKEQRFFHVIITFNGEESGIEEYTDALRKFRTVILNAKGQLETLNNDVSAYYAQKSYPLIHKLENLMRKLITYFMLTQVGKDWVIEASPKDIQEAINKTKRPQQYGDALHQVDFIHLGDFLFKAYQTKEISKLHELLDSVEKVDDLSLDELREYKAKSNWERYFSKVVDCTDEYLNKRWKELYELRCKIAHNAIVSKNDYERIVELANQVSEKLENAIKNLSNIQVPEDEKEILVENAVSNINALSGEFIHYWKLFEITLNKVAISNGILKEDSGELSSKLRVVKSPSYIFRELWNSSSIPLYIYDSGISVTRFRNELIHSANLALTENEIEVNIACNAPR